ncbi:MAG TPA: YciI family protein, partial [Roseiflexaceae bacterium]|nr:YciI family protein [Roseiflexaceae bacterium]
MRYLLLIYGNEQAAAAQSPEAQAAEMDAWWKYTADLRQSGQHLGGEALQPIATATTVRMANGRPLVADGPFAETKEQLGGYYLIDVPDL